MDSLYYDGFGSHDSPQNSLSIKPLKEVEQNYIFRQFINVENKRRTKSVPWRVGQLWSSKKNSPNKPLKEIEKNTKKIASVENFTRKKKSIELSLYYEGYGSCGALKNVPTIKPLKEVEKIIVSRELVNEENKHQSESVLLRVRHSRFVQNLFQIEPLKKSTQ